MGRVVRLARIPDCDFCAKDGKVTSAIVDGKTIVGGWANMCTEHRKRWSVGGPTPPGEHPLENPLALEEVMSLPKPLVAGMVDAVRDQLERDDFIREAMANPPMDRIQQMIFDEIRWEAVDGCVTDPSGQCEHGYPSWGVALGIF